MNLDSRLVIRSYLHYRSAYFCPPSAGSYKKSDEATSNLASLVSGLTYLNG